jgi:hypothetical protein
MFDESGISLSASDPNPSIDQEEDFGSSADYSSILNSVGQWGTEIASVVTGRPVAYAPTPGGGIRPIGATGSYVTGGLTPVNSTTKLFLGVLVVVGGLLAIQHLSK